MSRIYESVDPAYAATCSDVTVCSNSKGFFRGLLEEVTSLPGTSWLQQYEREDPARMVPAVMEHHEIMGALTEVFARIQPLHRGKDARVSCEKRAACAVALRSGDLRSALGLASQAVLRAPATGVDEVIDGGVSLAMGLWSRAEVLLALGRPAAALEDLKMALKERLPAKMRAQYYWRMGHCYKGTGEGTRAKVSYELAARLLATDEPAKTQLQEDIQSLDYSITPKHPPAKTGATVTSGAKQNTPALSKLVKIAEDEAKGRYAVANEEIKTGDVLLVDSPYAACLLSDYYGTHCLHCFQRLDDDDSKSPVGCPMCAGVAFCSSQCRELAVSSYHPHECQFLDLFIGSGMSILSHIALRMVTQAGLETSLDLHSKYVSNEVKTVESAVLNDIEGVNKKSKMKSRKERLNRSKKGLNNNKSLNDKSTKEEESEVKEETANFEESQELKAAQIYSLCTHSDIRKGEDYLKRVVMAMFLTECLKKGGFFKTCDKTNLEKAHLSICELLVRNLLLLQFNAHEIYETLRGSHVFSGSKANYIAVGIYPTGALFNHECYPAVARYFEGRKIVLRAIRPLSEGEVVAEHYGPHFMMRGLKERQRSLASRYWFKCECLACKEDWPSMKQMNSESPIYLRCPKSSCSWKFKANAQKIPNRCAKCSTYIDHHYVADIMNTIDVCVEQYQEGAKLMEQELPLEAIASMCKGIDSFHEVARPPHKDTHIAQESLRSCFAAYGNIYNVRDDGVKQNGK